MEVNVLDRIKLGLNYLLPKKCLTELFGWFADKKAGWITKIAIDIFIWYYNVDMKESEKSDTSEYSSFNNFFVRTLRKTVRPINSDPNMLVQPADGVISQIGDIKDDYIFQAKGHVYSLESLLAGNYHMSKKFINGSFVNIYIEPKNYHRVHMPCNGILREMIYVPGDLYSVNHTTARNIPNLFARNERIVCYFDSVFGAFVQILVGAIIVGSIETIWSGQITPPRRGVIKRWEWPSYEKTADDKEKNNICLLKGQEMGRFKLGSTVINLFPHNTIEMLTNLTPLSKTFVGKPLGIIRVQTKN